MKEITLKGFYRFDQAEDGQGRLEATLNVEDDGSFEGQIKDFGSRSPDQHIKGHLHNYKGRNMLTFVKTPHDSQLANLVYQLYQPISDTIEGSYMGSWMAVPKPIQYDRRLPEFLEAVSNSGIPRIRDYAQLNLSLK